MSDPAIGPDPVAPGALEDRLDSWKEIAAYLKRDVTTVRRWEKREGMPVHRHLHDKLGSVYASRSELNAWARSRNLRVAADPDSRSVDVAEAALDLDEPSSQMVNGAPVSEPASVSTAPPPSTQPSVRRSWRSIGVATLVALGVTVWLVRHFDVFRDEPLALTRFEQLTDFDGIEQAAAISRDGRFVAFLSDRDGPVDVWLTQLGTGQFYNLTRGAFKELVNPSVRTLGFSPDGTYVTFWTRRSNQSKEGNIGIWAVPILGGQPRPYLEGAAEFDWSSDGARLVYHTTGPGDPMFVKDQGLSSEGRQILVAPSGLHSHFPLWALDQSFIYFVQGSLPDAMDIWRIKPTGGPAERITHHNSRVSHPVLWNQRTLMYLATEPDGSGPRLYSVDVERRVPHLMTPGLDDYTSLGASADGRRLVATATSPKGTFWTLPISPTAHETSSATRMSLTTGSGFSPRLAANYLVYARANGSSEGIWKLADGTTTQLWSAPAAHIIGGPAIAPNGRRIAFSVEQGGRTTLYVMDADGADLRVVAQSLALQGAPAWAPDGESIASAAVDDGVPHLYVVRLDGGPAVRVTRDYSVDPVWDPDGRFIVYSGPDIGTTFSVKAVAMDGSPYSIPDLTLTRGARHLRFLPGSRALVVMRGDIEHKDLWLIDLETRAERQLTTLGSDFNVRDFDISSDGRSLVLDRVQEQSDIVLIDAPGR